MAAKVQHVIRRYKKLVKRTENTGLDKFIGTVQDVQFETSEFDGEKRRQYHITIDAEDVEVEGKTGLLHEWVPLSPKSSETEVPQGSIVDRYLQQVEICIDEASNAKTVKEALDMMKGKKFNFKRLKLGRDYDGHKAKEYIAPVSLA